MEKILISACLVGRKVRYDGEASTPQGEWIQRWRRQGRLVPVCPEVAGGLAVPRLPAELVGGDGEDVLDGRATLCTAGGEDVTQAFVDGAHRALEVARREAIRVAILKARSPSCGAAQVYDGTFSKTLQVGMGVAAALLRREGIVVFSDEELDAAVRHLAALAASSK